jgi:hypothetical protein
MNQGKAWQTCWWQTEGTHTGWNIIIAFGAPRQPAGAAGAAARGSHRIRSHRFAQQRLEHLDDLQGRRPLLLVVH